MSAKNSNWTKLQAVFKQLRSALHGEKSSNQPVWLNLDNERLRGEINLADLLMTIKDLPWESEGQLRQIAQSLGFTWQGHLPEPIAIEHSKGVYDRNRHAAQPKPKPNLPELNIPFSAPPPPELPIELPPQVLSSTLTTYENCIESGQQPDWLYQQTNDLLSEEEELPRLARKNLFPTHTSRGVLSASLRVQRTSAEPDVPQIIRRMVRGEILRTLPRIRGTTLGQGCQLLLDYSDSMIPYWEDLNELAMQVENVIGTNRLHIYEFEGNPLEAKHREINGERQGEKARPIVVASNLDVGVHRRNPIINKYWRQFIHQCKQAGSPLLILTPWQRESWPSGLGDYPILIHWNPRTTAGMVQQLVGKGHEVEL